MLFANCKSLNLLLISLFEYYFLEVGDTHGTKGCSAKVIHQYAVIFVLECTFVFRAKHSGEMNSSQSVHKSSEIFSNASVDKLHRTLGLGVIAATSMKLCLHELEQLLRDTADELKAIVRVDHGHWAKDTHPVLKYCGCDGNCFFVPYHIAVVP